MDEFQYKYFLRDTVLNIACVDKSSVTNVVTIDEICEMLKIDNGLIVSEFRIITFRHGFIEPLLKAIKTTTKVKKVCLHVGPFVPNFGVLSYHLATNATLHTFILKGFFVVSVEIRECLVALIHHTTSLREIDFSALRLNISAIDAIGKTLSTNSTITSVKLGGELPTRRSDLKKVEDLLWEKNFSLLELTVFDTIKSVREQPPVSCFPDLCKRNYEMTWRGTHKLIVDIVIAMEKIYFPGYVLLWIINWLPYMDVYPRELKKITLIQGLINSFRRVEANRIQKPIK